MKNCLFALGLVSLALAVGCAKGGNGVVPPSIAVDVSSAPINENDLYPTQSLTLTATVTPTGTSPAVTWSLSGAGTLTPVSPATNPATAVYVATGTVGSTGTVTATSVADTTKTGTLILTVTDVTTDVTPSTLTVGNGLTQQFTAVAVPDDAPQEFTWTCTAGGVPCANFVPDPNIPSLARYKAQDSCSGSCIQVSAAAPLDPNGCSVNPKNCTIAKASLVPSRVSGTYAFRFSGYDSSNSPTAVVGTFTASANGSITSGFEDETTSGGTVQQAITGGSYAPITGSDPNSNNAGTLTLTTGAFPNKFQVVLDGAGDIEMIESDNHGTGSGIAQKSASASIFSGDQTFAFGFTGADSNGDPVGYVGVLPMNGSGSVIGGQMDVNDNGNATNICGAGPCSVSGSYTADGSVAGLWHMSLNAGTALLLNFDFFIAAGQANKTNPLTFYAISTNPVATHPTVSGTMVLQDSSQTYNNNAFKGISVSALTGTNGANSNVSLTLGATDGNGNFSGLFDQNNAGTIISAASFPPSHATTYTYMASGTSGRYIFNMLGNPTANPVVAPIPFVLYASGQNRGFLLDQSSASVMTGTMNPQGKGGGSFSGSVLPGTFGAATISSGTSSVTPMAANLLITYNGGSKDNLAGTQYPGSQTVTGTNDFGGNANGAGIGTLTLSAPAAATYVIYVLDTTGCTSTPVCSVDDFFMMDVDKTNPVASILFAQQ